MIFALIVGSIGITTNTEARLPKRTSELMLNSIIDDLGIASDIFIKAPIRSAILKIIYTEQGNQSVVDFVRRNSAEITGGLVQGEFFNIIKSLSTNKAQLENQIYVSKLQQLVKFLFPCYTGTFTAYKHNSNDSLGWWVLHSNDSKFSNLNNILSKETKKVYNIKFGNTDVYRFFNEFVAELDEKVKSLLSVLFAIEILDNPSQIQLAFDLSGAVSEIFYDDIKYKIRPLPNSATERYHSDCIDTTLKHLLSLFCNKSILPERIDKYLEEHKNENETSINSHKEWRDILTNYVPEQYITPNLWGLIKSLAIITIGSNINEKMKPLIGAALAQCDTRSSEESYYDENKYNEIVLKDKQQLLTLLQLVICSLNNCEINSIEITINDLPEKRNSIWPTETISITNKETETTIVLGTGGLDYKDCAKVPVSGVHTEITSIQHKNQAD